MHRQLTKHYSSKNLHCKYLLTLTTLNQYIVSYFILYVSTLTTCTLNHIVLFIYVLKYVFQHYDMFYIFSFAKEFGHPDWQAYGSFIHRWIKRYGIVNRAISSSKESAAPLEELDTWKETVLLPTLSRYSPNDIYNGDETALFYKCLPHRTYCFNGDKPAGSAKRKDRLTLLMITNMDGSDHRKLAVIGKSKTPWCLGKKYKMQVKDMAVDWYASKNAWMTGDIHHKIMSKFNDEMRKSNRHILYVCDNASSHQVREYSHIKFLMLPPNATSIMQPLDQGIILSTKRRYKKKLAERYLVCVENNKDANSLLKSLDIVVATNMIAASWRETSATIIQNCFRKAGFKHHIVDPAPATEDPLPRPSPEVWNRVQKWIGEVEFDEYAASEPDGATEQPMSDQEIVHLVHTENDTQEEDEEEDDSSDEESTCATAIKNSAQFLAMLDQQKAFLKRNDMALDIVEQLEAQIIGNQASLCSTQKNIKDYFRVDNFRTVADATKNVSIVDSLDFHDDDIDIQSINTTVASVAATAFMRNEITPGCTSTPKRQHPTSSQPPKKKYKLIQAIDKVMNMTTTTCNTTASLDSDSESLFSQD